MNIIVAIPFSLCLLTFVLFCGWVLDLIGTILIATYDEIRMRVRIFRWRRRNGKARRWRT